MSNSIRYSLLWIAGIVGLLGFATAAGSAGQLPHSVDTQPSPPLPPAVFYGTILPSSAFTPVAGMVLQAYIGSNLCGQTAIKQAENDITFAIVVTADTTQAGCGTAGRFIQFRTADNDLSPTVEWDNRQPHELQLHHASVTDGDVTISIGVSADDVELSWIANAVNQAYEIHRSPTPFFTPSTNTLIAILPATATSYTDPGVGGDPKVSYFYAVLTVNGTIRVYTDQVGAISYTLNNTGGKYSLIALPFLPQGVTNAASLANYIGNVGGLLKWNPPTRSFRFFSPPNSGDNFSIARGDVVFTLINSGGPNVVTIAGLVAPIQFTLYPDGFNFISLPLQKRELLDAAAVAANMTTVESLLSWNDATQLFRFFVPLSGGDNFAVRPGSPFIVRVGSGEPTSWPLSD